MDWFQALFGFQEGAYEWTRNQFEYANGILTSRVNGRLIPTGTFETPSLRELRKRARSRGRTSTLRHEVIGDVLPLHSTPENAEATFQVASQFNCLEFVSPDITPLDGVTAYANDPTQGPACSLAAAGATVVRNYFAFNDGTAGQTDSRQIDNLAGLEQALPGGPYWTVRNGYTFSTSAQLKALEPLLTSNERDEWLSHVRIGWHRQVGVTFSDRYVLTKKTHLVSQTFCSAISCAYTDLPRQSWRSLATLVLDAAYEATLLAAAIDRDEGTGSGKVWLTLLGGGVFGNDDGWIYNAISRAIQRTRNLGLDIRLAHYRALKHPFRELAGP